ncbi:MAG: hypothetical protein IJ263_04950, partial [Paludibacteraceae bacterium]|nr:hypothetical protein [Paludibacteraceae bacterium]
ASTSQTICKENISGVETIIVNAATNGTAGDLTYTWTLPSADESASPAGNTHKPAVTEVGTYVYKVTVSDACTKNKTEDLTYTLTIDAAPTLPALTAPSAICEGGSFSLPTVTPADNGSSITSEGWEYNDGGVWMSFANSNLQPGNYILRYVATNACGTTESALAQSVNVSAASVISVTPQLASICKNTQPVLNVTSITGDITKITADGSALASTAYVYNSENKTITLPEISEQTVYVVTVKNGACDEKTSTATIAVNDIPTITVTAPASVCEGNTFSLSAPTVVNNGSDLVGTGKWQIKVKGEGEWTDFDNTSAQVVGTHKLQYVSANGCGENHSNEVDAVVNKNPILVVDGKTDQVCDNEGWVKLSASNGTPSYTYKRGDVTVTLDGENKVTGLSAGTYSFTVNDANNCSATVDNIEIGNFSSINAGELASVEAICADGSLPTLKFVDGKTPNGGSGSYTYKWYKNDVEITGATSESYTPSIELVNGLLPAGEYSYKVEVSDGTACGNKMTNTVVLTVNPKPVVSLGADETLCSTSVSFAPTVTVGGETKTAGVTYEWAGVPTGKESAASQTLTLADGENSTTATYSVVATYNGCSSQADEKVGTIHRMPTISFANPTDLCATNASYDVVATVDGYTDDATYTWTGGTESADHKTLTVSKKSTCAQTYDYSLKVAAGACTTDVETGSFTTKVDEISLTASSTPVALTSGTDCKYSLSEELVYGNLNFTAPSCIETIAWTYKNGSATIDSWPLSIESNTAITVTAEVCGQKKSATVNVTVPDVIAKPTITATPNICDEAGATGDVTVTNYDNANTYELFNNGTKVTATITTDGKFTALGVGKYTVKVTNPTTGCSDISEVAEIKYYDEFSVTASGVNKCYDGNNVTLTANVGGSTAGYTFYWNNGVDPETSIAPTVESDGTADVAETWTVRAENSTTGCKSKADPTISVNIYKLPEAKIDVVSVANCAVNLKSHNEDANYSYSWNLGGSASTLDNVTSDVTLTITENHAATSTACTSKNTDNKYTFDLSVPEVKIAKSSDAVCAGETATLTASDTRATQSAPYTYLWSETEIPTNVDKSTVTGTLGTQTLTETKTYYVAMKDANGCVGVAGPASVTVNSNPVLDPISNVTLCYNETKTISTPAVAGYTYSWKKDGVAYGENTNSITTVDYHGEVEYSLTVTDANNCSSNEIKFTVTQPASDIALSESVTGPSVYGLNDGSYTITVDGGYGDYKYCVRTSESTSCDPVTSMSTNTISETNVKAGNYYYTIADKNGCKIDVTIEVPSPAVPSVTWSKVDALCHNGNSNDLAKFGTIKVTSPSGAFTIKMTDPATGYADVTSTEVGGENVAAFTGLNDGTYTVKYELTANPLISEEKTFEITEPDLLSFSLNYAETGSTPCTKNYNEIIISNVSGGTPVDNLESSKEYYDGKYEVSYTDVETTVSYADGKFTLANGISTAKLTATLTDKNGCVASQTVEYTPKP